MIKRLVAFSVIPAFVVVSYLVVFPSDDGAQEVQLKSTDKAEPFYDSALAIPESVNEINDNALPDFPPILQSKQDLVTDPVIEKPVALDETIESVEEVLGSRIEALNQNLGDAEVRDALKRDLKGADMQAYKAAVLWKVKNSEATQ
ncbi:hypothetical protein LPB19_03710 [Marinobacter salinisoli]|uniref:Uncharacterized protein n=1 Tax=Marinobacter salinisoli TaxID=2769486 RepID=A0ABX7MT93_9GAMM|nr:hypothetical protein [Marinobacter salinisoli]QSP95533.1 hypothetical protein LPB19_03710 [Marinobacter salinisoli]